MITGIHHITINVKDLAQTRKFYGELLGLKRLEDVAMSDHMLSYYALPGGIKLELISYHAVTKICTAGLFERGRFRHLALQVDSTETLEMIASKLAQYGGRVLQPPKWVESLQFTGMLAEDPNGCELELLVIDQTKELEKEEIVSGN